MTNGEPKALRTGGLSGEEISRLQEKLLELLARRTALYTMGESSSIPRETAEELLRSLCYTLRIGGDAAPERLRELLDGDLSQAYEKGVRLLEIKREVGRRLWQSVCLSASGLKSCSLEDTLVSIGGFWKRYDLRFFPHKIPCDIDYPLCQPVPEALMGVDYVNEYLRRLLLECQFLCRLDAGLCDALLKSICPDYRWLVLNLYEPVAVNAIGLALAGGDIRDLDISEQERARIRGIMAADSEKAALNRLRCAAQSVCAALHIPGRTSANYLEELAEGLYPRIREGELQGLFLSLRSTA